MLSFGSDINAITVREINTTDTPRIALSSLAVRTHYRRWSDVIRLHSAVPRQEVAAIQPHKEFPVSSGTRRSSRDSATGHAGRV